jgi:ZIP family zinc transporter
MVPQALELGSLPLAVGGFLVGFGLVYGFDLFIHRGKLAGEEAEQHAQVERFYHRKRPRGGIVTVLAGGTSAEELIEGIAIGAGAVIKPGLGLLIGLAIAIDNISEGLSIGELIRDEKDGKHQTRRILGWTGLIGAALVISALIGWFLLRGLPEPAIGFMFAIGAGGMFYLTITDLVPQAEQRQYQQSGAIATGAGFLTILVLSSFF